MTSHQDVEQSGASLSDNPLLFQGVATDPPSEDVAREFVQGLDEDPGGILELSPSEIIEGYASGDREKIVEYPNDLLYHLVSVVREEGYDDLHVNGEVPRAHQRIEDLRACDIGTLVSVECRINNRTDVYPRHVVSVFKCLDCESPTDIEWDQSLSSPEIEYPHQCRKCGNKAKKNFEHKSNKGDVVDRQQLIAQDLHANSSTTDPADIRADAHNLLVNDAESGETVTLTGILRSTETDEKDSEMYLQVLGVEHHDRGYSGVELTEEDKEENREIANSENVYDTLASSIAPSIKGDYKLARMAGLYQLAGGVRHDTTEEKERENIHVAYVGDPGTGKSDIAKFLASVAPKSVYQSADNATEVGITASISYEDKFDTTKATLSGGALVKADGGMCVLDELDKGSDGVRNCLQEPLEEQEVSVAKHDIRATLPTRCGVMLVANPVDSRFDMDVLLQNQMNLNDVIWDRMDMIIPFVNQPDEDVDRDIADAAVNRAKGITGDYMSTDELQKYIAHARTIDPKMTDEAHEIIKEAWVDWRSGATQYRTPVGVRQLYSLIRISEASARLRLGEEVTNNDAERAVDMMEAWMFQMMVNDRGQLDRDVLSGKSAPDREALSVVRSTIENHGDNGELHRNEVVQIVTRELGIEKDELQQKINGKMGDPKSNLSQADGMLVLDGDSQ